MFRATTPTHSFVFDVDPETTFKTILITYAQDNIIILEKHKEDLTFSGTEASLRLSQDEANLFDSSKTAIVQIRVLTYEDEAIAFDKIPIAVRAVINDEVLT